MTHNLNVVTLYLSAFFFAAENVKKNEKSGVLWIKYTVNTYKNKAFLNIT